MARTRPVDLVLSGGGVKGVGLVGAVVALMDAGYRPHRVSGTSAGSIVGAVVAAAQVGTMSGQQVKDLALQLDYSKFLDPGPVERVPFVGPSLALLRGSGIYKGDYIREWVRSQLADLGVHTFGDLRTDDPGDDGHLHHRYGLVVTASDLTRKRLVRLPWDYAVYDLDPDEQSVAAAVRASASIPFFFEPVLLRGPRGTAT
ncbi:MAG TPA: patatin-like phospholipase family protein, partial [Mycobacterium sp.]|nr:patatin-like phospholipase family protein [Mycobacterium sp.]